MVRRDEMRDGERAVATPPATDAGLVFIGRIHTPWQDRMECPRQGRADGPLCQIVIDDVWKDALKDIELYDRLEILYWLHRSRRDLVWQSPKSDGTTRGTFSLRSPVRPNPIGTSVVFVERVEGTTLFVRGLDCLDETPVIDIKPARESFVPLAPPTPGDAMTNA
ncbi:tRNA (N6-threonylcarbamoyladenosine(37)-N6)-methyltransferase TrmO [Consotaella salsifontis]|uniref:tRNA-Thr(GGU) m(6)t(6)A37 methyltransferase TsaA n=1 Tax=Consotaella salsifontis TaxID=1365950 RepID=A0A1T4T3B8_9HYPH|nr:tRNA (N6-threonylcarbamoyladenosine(37)-N6)-methyltransferase TrmO [Consotaella salsifontis]SKA34897.1 tRNA-Thr(GGU) m(6)t(6)A37 methyltransferase TsaA [Consotaella salsifontis]